ncbi:hypothetical protein DVH24_029309 [Malus domestica]|uniref:glutaredoxin-dependent peroxiredoxin n=1 Tax=Malus domestica TaxID=3750 RepID=A0A498HSQ3_MALDO|nr:hypothetical protein DVH24_029309 [Malus domestica]
MAPIAVGDVIPDGTLAYLDEADKVQSVNIHSLAAGKKISSSASPVPSPSLAVNDPFVMKAWAKTYPENKDVLFHADGSAKYTHDLGLELDLPEKGLGTRSKRFALLIEYLKVKAANIESGGEFTISSADDILKAL